MAWKQKPAAQREDQRKGESGYTDASAAVSHARAETVMSYKEILKNKSDRTNFQKGATFSKFQSSN